MPRIFQPSGGIYLGMTRIYQLLVLNVLFVVTALPLVTLGAAFSAAYGTSFKIRNGAEEQLVKTYFRQFKANFRQSTIIWLGIMLVGGIFYSAYPWVKSFFQTFPATFYVFALVLAVLLLALAYVFPMIAHFASPSGLLLLNSLLLALKHLPYSLLIFFLFTGVGVLLPVFVPQLFLLWLLLGFGSVIYISSYWFEKIFAYYVEEDKGR
ncbi:YesL family protein [Enterococcus nangangensis]|uniref:YesL family protein n=1 Tax=Enterococcus nangangensis TaxID=2559926 RepID=UPI0010F6FF35|nr:YesL family protein [Enterococcus nangangensis]